MSLSENALQSRPFGCPFGFAQGRAGLAVGSARGDAGFERLALPKSGKMNRLTEWIDHGLKYARWPPSRAARIALLVALGLSLVGVYLVQSSHIVTASRHVETLRRDLMILRRENALRLSSIAAAGSAARLLERATALGFQPAEIVEFVAMPTPLRDDAPSLRDGYLEP